LFVKSKEIELYCLETVFGIRCLRKMFLKIFSIAVINTAVQGQPLYDEMSDPCKDHRKSYEIYKEHLLSLQLENKKLQEKRCKVKACPDNWICFENICYLFSEAKTTFDAAKVICNRAGAYILEDQTPWERSLTKAKGYTHMWIGATDILKEGVYVYESTGSIVTNGDWVKGQPGGGRNENCVAALKSSNWQWHDYSCDHEFDYVCKKSKNFCVKT
ncbi:perlucin-like protein, partial [Saccostrea cucullata]|uniref:perlucin-like protein n=1 Tax=Saccostrea cuccullata TaxID=36930 RepID=UPI002ED45A32